jgi:hypothetical protein
MKRIGCQQLQSFKVLLAQFEMPFQKTRRFGAVLLSENQCALQRV